MAYDTSGTVPRGQPSPALPPPKLIAVLSQIVSAVAFGAMCILVHAAPAERMLRVSAIPDEAPTELQRKFAPLGRYLERETGMKVQFIPVTDYAAVVESLAAGRLDLAWLGGFTYVQAKDRTHGAVTPIVQREEDERFTSKFITANETIHTLADLKGKTFAFGSPASTSGHLMPRYFLLQAGVDPDRDFRYIAYSGAHDATAAFVQSGKVDAGVLNASVWDKLVEQKKIDPARVRVFATTPPYHDYNWTIRGGMDPALVRKLTDAFLKLDPRNPEHRAILALQRASRFIPTRPENYAGIEHAARAAKLMP
jgi:phosphonate transport system substrate-binding protein